MTSCSRRRRRERVRGTGLKHSVESESVFTFYTRAVTQSAASSQTRLAELTFDPHLTIHIGVFNTHTHTQLVGDGLMGPSEM